jgi:hypothetical protein
MALTVLENWKLGGAGALPAFAEPAPAIPAIANPAAARKETGRHRRRAPPICARCTTPIRAWPRIDVTARSFDLRKLS